MVASGGRLRSRSLTAFRRSYLGQRGSDRLEALGKSGYRYRVLSKEARDLLPSHDSNTTRTRRLVVRRTRRLVVEISGQTGLELSSKWWRLVVRRD